MSENAPRTTPPEPAELAPQLTAQQTDAPADPAPVGAEPGDTTLDPAPVGAEPAASQAAPEPPRGAGLGANLHARMNGDDALRAVLTQTGAGLRERVEAFATQLLRALPLGRPFGLAPVPDASWQLLLGHLHASCMDERMPPGTFADWAARLSAQRQAPNASTELRKRLEALLEPQALREDAPLWQRSACLQAALGACLAAEKVGAVGVEDQVASLCEQLRALGAQDAPEPLEQELAKVRGVVLRHDQELCDLRLQAPAPAPAPAAAAETGDMPVLARVAETQELCLRLGHDLDQVRSETHALLGLKPQLQKLEDRSYKVEMRMDAEREQIQQKLDRARAQVELLDNMLTRQNNEQAALRESTQLERQKQSVELEDVRRQVAELQVQAMDRVEYCVRRIKELDQEIEDQAQGQAEQMERLFQSTEATVHSMVLQLEAADKKMEKLGQKVDAVPSVDVAVELTTALDRRVVVCETHVSALQDQLRTAEQKLRSCCGEVAAAHERIGQAKAFSSAAAPFAAAAALERRLGGVEHQVTTLGHAQAASSGQGQLAKLRQVEQEHAQLKNDVLTTTRLCEELHKSLRNAQRDGPGLDGGPQVAQCLAKLCAVLGLVRPGDHALAHPSELPDVLSARLEETWDQVRARASSGGAAPSNVLELLSRKADTATVRRLQHAVDRSEGLAPSAGTELRLYDSRLGR